MNYLHFINIFLAFNFVTLLLSGCSEKPAHLNNNRVSLTIPLYSYPTTINPNTSNTYWEDVISVADGNNMTVIINPTNGDHDKKVDRNFKEGIKKLKTSGVRVLGYTYTKYAKRERSLIEESIRFYADEYDVDKFFLDEVNSSKDALPYYRQLQSFLLEHSLEKKVMLNPGVVPNMDMMNDTTMQRVIFEGTSQSFFESKSFTGVREEHRKNNICLIYDVTQQQMQDVVDLAIIRRCGQLYVTDDGGENPWDTLPTYWASLIEYVDKINSI